MTTFFTPINIPPSSANFMTPSRLLSSSSSFSHAGTLVFKPTTNCSISFSSPSHFTNNNFSSNRRRGTTFFVFAAANHYSTLGLPRSATCQEIKSAYRTLARQYHPDVNKEAGATAKFKEISAAYEVLSDDKKRAMYDRYGEDGVKSTTGGQSGASGTNSSDVYERAYTSGGRRATNATKGQDIRYSMTLEFSAVMLGIEKEIELFHLEKCEVCMGTGAKVGSKMRTCSTCGGKGQAIKTQQYSFGSVLEVYICQDCNGKGEIISEYCRKCSGEGRIRRKKDIKVKVPPGVDKGSIIKVVGAGDAGPKGGPAGDLNVYIDVEELPQIKRDGVNLHSSISVSYLDAILGTVVKVKTVEGITELQIPACTQPGDILVLEKKGVPKYNIPSIRGDHLFTIKVTLPKRISKAQLEMDTMSYFLGLEGAHEAQHELETTKELEVAPHVLWVKLSDQEREHLEALASLTNPASIHPRFHPDVQQTAKITETEVNPVADESNSSEDQDDPLHKLTDFVGSVVKGALNWFKDEQ